MTRGSQTRSHALFICIVISIHFYIFASRELNVIDSGTVTLVITVLVKTRRVTQGYLL